MAFHGVPPRDADVCHIKDTANEPWKHIDTDVGDGQRQLHLLLHRGIAR